MKIYTKLEEIRRQPDHIRMRYALGSVIISMLFISILWIFSITSSFQNQTQVQDAYEPVVPVEKQGTQPAQNTPDSGASSGTSTTNQADVVPSLNEWIKK
jgi:hypothetical protein